MTWPSWHLRSYFLSIPEFPRPHPFPTHVTPYIIHYSKKPVATLPHTQVNQTMTDNDVDLSHSFWSRAARKVTPKQRHTYPTNRRSRQTQVNKDRRMDEGNTSNGNDVNTGNRCFNCYETNHTAKTCRHEGPLICNDCGAEGHKAKHHSY